MLSKILKRYDTVIVLPNVIYSFNNFDINNDGVKLSRAKHFLTMLPTYNLVYTSTETTHSGIVSS